MRQQLVAGLAALALVLGIVCYGFAAYRVAVAGGFASSSVRQFCAQAATGIPKGTYRNEESITIQRSYLPPHAECRWSGGTTVALIPQNALSWAGPTLLVLSVAGGGYAAALGSGERRRRRALRPPRI